MTAGTITPRSARRDECPHFPEQVEKLYSREREVARIVYARGGATAHEIEEEISTPLANAAVRLMLRRLIRKGVLKRRRSGRHKAFLYLPAILTTASTERALKKLAKDHFGGSIYRATLAMIDLANSAEHACGNKNSERWSPLATWRLDKAL